MHNLHNTKTKLNVNIDATKEYYYYSLPKLAEAYNINLNKLPISIRIVLESVLRNYDNVKITETHIKELANWQAVASRKNEIPFVVSRVVLQDFTGVPLLCDLAAMRTTATKLNKDPKKIEPLVPVDLVVDHSVQVDHYGTKTSLEENMQLEFIRNKERYQFMKWGMQAFNTFGVVPPGIGIVHQVNLEYFFRGVHHKNNILYPDTLVGTDSHTTMINGLGVVAWGVGGIEAEAAMLGQPVYFLTPDVIGVELSGKLNEGITATDLVLNITEFLRAQKVVGKFVEFFGSGVKYLSATDRATIANMAPEYGATMGFFGIDEKTIEYMRYTGKTELEIQLFEEYFKAQNMFGIANTGDIVYSKELKLDLNTIKPTLAGPKRPQDKLHLDNLASSFNTLFSKPINENGFNKNTEHLQNRYYTIDNTTTIGHGDIMIAAITSCTNTSNPNVLITAGLLAKRAVELGLTINPRIKTSLAPGSRVVTDYLEKSNLQQYLDKLGFTLAGYGCTTCIGNSGDLAPEYNETIIKNDIICAAILSGNRNFEARIHPNIKANFLASPPLVIAFALAGRINIDLTKEPIGMGHNNTPVFLKDIWPNNHEVQSILHLAQDPNTFKRLYTNFKTENKLWNEITSDSGHTYTWPQSTYIAQPPFFEDFALNRNIAMNNIENAKALLVLGDSVTTDHISPAGSFKEITPAGEYLIAHGVEKSAFNSYGSRRGNHEIMMRGTFANVRIKNLMLSNYEGKQIEGGYTLVNNTKTTVYAAAIQYIQQNIPTIVFAGEEYGTGSSRDWAAKGTKLLGVKAVIAKSFERIHRSNLVGMGILPLQFKDSDTVANLKITGLEDYSITGISNTLKPQQDVQLTIKYTDGSCKTIDVICRIDTPIEIEYYKKGGILPYVLNELLA